MDGKQIFLGLYVDSKFAFCACDLGCIFLARSHHTRAVQLRNLAIVELDDTDCVVSVAVVAEVGLYCGDADSTYALDFAIIAKEPQCEIDIVDRAVDEDATGKAGVLHEEARRVELVARLGAEDRGCADAARLQAGEGVSIGGVEAPGETAEDFLGGVRSEGGLVGGDYRLRLQMLEKSGHENGSTYSFRACGKWLLAKNMQAELNCFYGLFGVHGGG